MAFCAFAAAWTGKLDKVYELPQLYLNYEGVHYFDGDIYASTVRGTNIYRFDPDRSFSQNLLRTIIYDADIKTDSSTEKSLQRNERS